MFWTITRFEAWYQLRNVYLLAWAFLSFAVTLGLFLFEPMRIDPGVSMTMTSATYFLIIFVGIAVSLIIPMTAILGGAVARDLQLGSGDLLKATLITRTGYVFGRFFGAFLPIALIFLIHIPLVWLACEWPGLPPNKFPNIKLAALLQPAAIAASTLFITACILFAVGTLARSALVSYIVVALLLGAWVFTLSKLPFGGYEDMRNALDWTGFASVFIANEARSIFERNTELLVISPEFYYNRVGWMGIGALCLVAAWAFQGLSGGLWGSRRVDSAAGPNAPEVGPLKTYQTQIDAAAVRTQIWTRLTLDFKRLVISRAFVLLMFGGIYLFWVIANNTGSFGDRGIEPVTRLLVKELHDASTFMIFLTASVFASELVWGDTDRRIHELVDVTPTSTWVYVAPKLLVICVASASFVLVGSVVGMIAQAAKGYPLFEVGKIAIWLWLPLLFVVFQFGVAALLCHCITPNKVWGWILYMALTAGISSLAAASGIDHVLLVYGANELAPLSDFNGLAHFWRGLAWLQLHWTLVTLFLLMCTVLMWRRGVEQRLKPRLAALSGNLRSANRLALAGFFLTSLASGSWIFYNTNIINTYVTDEGYNQWAAEVERTVAPLEALPGPTIVALKLTVDIRPKKVTATAKGTLTLENRTTLPLSQFIFNHSDLTLVSASMPGAALKEEVENAYVDIWTFTKPLQPGERRELSFETSMDGHSVASLYPPTSIVSNGTFIESTDLVPRVRIDREAWLTDPEERKKYGLPAKRPLPSAMLDENFYAPGSGWIDADITVSTDIGQIPVAPGILVRETIKDGRVTRQFRPPVKINNLFAIQSANYVVKRERIQLVNGPVELEIYHLPGFTRNLTTIMTAMKTSLQTFSKLYGPYPFGVLRIVQTPSYGAVDIAAQAYAGMVPFYEDGGWLQIIKDTAYSNNLSETVAHEVAHMWWGHQIDPSMRPGAKVLTESLAEMTSWLALQDVFPAEFVISYVNEAEDDYETKRGKETEGEPILTMMEGEEYLAYGKAPVALYILRNEIGHEAFDAALRSFIKRYAFADRPYPSLGDLLATLKAAAKPEVHVLIDQFFTDRVRWHTEIGSLDATKPNKSGSVVSVTAGAWTESLDELGMPYASAGIGRGRIQFFHSVPCDKEQFKSWTKFMTAEDMKSGKGECWASEEVATFTVDFKRTLGRFQFDIPTAKWVETVQIGPALRFRISTLSDSQSRSETFFPPHDFLPSQKPK
ncbi:MAG: hypothetical protein RL230_3020 [Pseudomonadota bacterium]|jgi:ABC-2 type transport system permease protein